MREHKNKRRRFEMVGRQRWAVYGASLALWLSGAVWVMAHFFWHSEGAFGPMVHPAEPWSMKVHGAALLVLALVLGALWPVHIKPAWRSGHNRRSGLGLGLGVGFLTLTGYLLYYGPGDAPREWIALTHWAFGLGAPLLLWLHIWLGRRSRRCQTTA